MDEAARERAIDELIELVAGVDGLLQKQVELDLQNFAQAAGRRLDGNEEAELRTALLAAKRWTFIQSGVTHPRFQELFAAVTTPAQQARVGQALNALLQPAVAAA